MKFLLLACVLAVQFLFIAFPDTVLAGGLVPNCSMGEGSEPCQACHVVELVNNVVTWLIGIMTIIAAILFAYAGILMVTSGGNASAKEKFKSIFTNVLIGYALVLGGWLLIDTLVKSFLDGAKFGMWHAVPCVDQPKAVQAIKEIIQLNDINFSTGRYALEVEFEEGQADKFGTDSGSGSLGSCQIQASGPCSESALLAAGFGSLSGAAARIAGAESGCNTNAESRTDTTTDGRTFSVGTWQINVAANRINCGGQQLDCPSAFRRTDRRNRFNVRMYEVINESLYRQCIQAAKDPACNNQIAARLARGSGDMGDWACSAKKCGVQTTRNHLCPLR